MLLRSIASVSLLEDASTAPLLTRPYLSSDSPSQLFWALAHVPELLEATAAFIDTVYGPTALSARLKEAVILRTSAINGCAYCVRVHGAIALETGFSPSEVARLLDASCEPDGFTTRETAAISFARAMCESPDDASRTALGVFAEHELVELAVVVGTTIFLNRFAKATGLS